MTKRWDILYECSLRRAAEKKRPYLVHFKQLFGPSYFVRALCPRLNASFFNMSQQSVRKNQFRFECRPIKRQCFEIVGVFPTLYFHILKFGPISFQIHLLVELHKNWLIWRKDILQTLKQIRH